MSHRKNLPPSSPLVLTPGHVRLLLLCLTGCATEASSPGMDSDTTVEQVTTDAGADSATQEVAADTGEAEQTEEAGTVDGDDGGVAAPRDYVIYDADQCMLTPLPSGLDVAASELCHSDEDCTQRPFGRCKGHLSDDGTIVYARCVFEDCESDDDCGQGESCECVFSAHQCVRSDCRKNDDCPEGEQCLRADVCGVGPFGPRVCTHPDDECLTNEDCAATQDANSCAFDMPAGHLVCLSILCE